MDKRIGIYLRVSTLGQSTDLQKGDIESFLASRGWSSFQFYEDKLSGTTTTRPALKRLLKDARERKIDVVVCWKIDRFFRSLKDLVATIHELNELGVEFISIKDQIDMTTATGRLLTHLIASFAEFEAALIKERVAAGLKIAKQKGIILGRPSTINRNEVVRLRSRGLSLNQIAKQLGTTKSGVSKTLKKSHVQIIEKTQAQTNNFEVSKTLVSETPPHLIRSITVDHPTSEIDSLGPVID